VYPKHIKTVTEKKAYNAEQEKERSEHYGKTMAGGSDHNRINRSLHRQHVMVLDEEEETKRARADKSSDDNDSNDDDPTARGHDEDASAARAASSAPGTSLGRTAASSTGD